MPDLLNSREASSGSIENGDTRAAAPLAFISCALTGGMTVPSQSPAIPVTPEQIVDSGVAASAAGAAILHIHVREPASGRPDADLGLFRAVLEGLAGRCEAIVQPTTGGAVGMSLADRSRVVAELRPEMASFNCASFNFGIFRARHSEEMAPWEVSYLESTRDYVFRNSFVDLERWCELFREAGTKPEFELYDVGHLYNLAYLEQEGLIDPPFHLQFVLGVLGANRATLDQLVHMLHTARALFGQSFTWSAAGVGYPSQFHMAASALMLGGHVRVGLEDNLRVERNRRAGSNAELVEKAVSLAGLLDRTVASPKQARERLRLGPRGV